MRSCLVFFWYDLRAVSKMRSILEDGSVGALVWDIEAEAGH